LTVVEGERPHSRLVMIEFPSRSAAEGWYRSGDNQKVISLRHKSSVGNVIIVAGPAWFQGAAISFKVNAHQALAAVCAIANGPRARRAKKIIDMHGQRTSESDRKHSRKYTQSTTIGPGRPDLWPPDSALL
jgi:Domain of unknown function (DUF1330)